MSARPDDHVCTCLCSCGSRWGNHEGHARGTACVGCIRFCQWENDDDHQSWKNNNPNPTPMSKDTEDRRYGARKNLLDASMRYSGLANQAESVDQAIAAYEAGQKPWPVLQTTSLDTEDKVAAAYNTLAALQRYHSLATNPELTAHVNALLAAHEAGQKP